VGLPNPVIPSLSDPVKGIFRHEVLDLFVGKGISSYVSSHVNIRLISACLAGFWTR